MMNNYQKTLGLRKPVVHRSATVTCKYCGNEQLQWRETGTGFKLFTIDGERHFCDGMRKQADYKLERDQRQHLTPTNRLVTAITEEMTKQLDAKEEDNQWYRDEIQAMLEKACLNALLQVV